MVKGTSYNELWGRPAWREAPELELTLGALTRFAAEHYPGNDYVVFDDERLTFGEAASQSALLARQLLLAGIGKGTRVGILLPNSPQFVISFLALIRIGALPVTISTLSTPAELLHLTRHADLHLLISTDRYLSHDYVAKCAEAFPGIDGQGRALLLGEVPFLRAIWMWGSGIPRWARAIDLADPGVSEDLLRSAESAVSPADPGVIIYTSGSTSAPKGIIHSHGSLVRQVRKLYANFPYTPDDRILSPQPFFWVGGLVMGMLQMLLVGGAIVGSIRKGAAMLDFIEHERISYVHAYAHVAKTLAAEPGFDKRQFNTMRGGRLTEAVPEHLRAKNLPFSNSLGMTETCGPHMFAYFDVPDELRGSLGTAMPGMEHRLQDPETGGEVSSNEPGELLVRGDTLMVGMVGRERSEVFTPDGWYRTGDICSLREGHLFFHGRIDDMIKSAGANVSPVEIEAVLKELPGVAQAYVFGFPDPIRGSLVGAIIVAETGVQPDIDVLQAEVARRVSSYKVPKIILTMDSAEIPSLSSGKINRKAVPVLLKEAYDRKQAANRAAR